MVSLVLLAAQIASAGPVSDPVLAVFTGGEVRASDVHREEAFLRPDERRFRERMGFAPRATWNDWIRRAALRRLVLARRADAAWGRDEARRGLARRTARDWWLARWGEECYGLPLEIPPDAELRARLTVPDLPERFRLSHIFLRAADDGERRAAEQRLQAIREQAPGLDAFREQARLHSRSESASVGGSLGVMSSTWLPSAVVAALAGVRTGGTTPPIALRGGVHVFYLEERLPAGPAPLEPRLARARRDAAAEARRRCRAARLAAAPPAPDGADDSEAERLFRVALQGGHVPSDARVYLDDLEADVWLRGWLEEEARARVEPPTEAELRRRFAGRARRTQPRFAVRLLAVDLSMAPDPLATWDALGALAATLRIDGSSWESASQGLPGARLEDVPLSDAIDLAERLGPRVLEGIKDLPKGAVAGPFRDGAVASVLGVLETLPSRERTFDEEREALVATLRRERQRAALEAVAREALSAAAYRLTREGERLLAALPDSAPDEVRP